MPHPDPDPDRPDWVEGTFRFDSHDIAVRELLALGPDVEVVIPAELRAAMAPSAAESPGCTPTPAPRAPLAARARRSEGGHLG